MLMQNMPAALGEAAQAPVRDVTDPRIVALAKNACALPDDEHSVDRALSRLRALGLGPSQYELHAAAESDRVARLDDEREDEAARRLAIHAHDPSESYRLEIEGDGSPGRGFSTGPLPRRSIGIAAASVMVAQTNSSPGPSDVATAVASPAAPGATAAGPDAGAIPSAAASGADAESAGSSAAPLPSPSAEPTALIPAAPPGPSTLVAPTDHATGPASPSPPPFPTSTPVVIDTGPVYLTNPTGVPTILPAGPSTAPYYAPGPARTPTPPPTPAASTKPQSRPIGILGPNQLAILSDRGDSSTADHQPADYDGNVHIFYATGQIVGDHAHYDGDHTITITGHTYLINRAQSAILYADEILFDTVARRALLIRGSGETTEGVDVGKLHYTGKQISSRGSSTHVDRASFTTCDKPHSGYHINARAIDVTPGDKLVAHNATIFLGALAIFYIPLLIIPLREIKDPRRQTQFLPEFGYSKTEGAYVMARLAFDAGPTYFGYYRVDYYTKRGLGLGYDAFIGTRNFRRQANIDAYTISDRITDTRETNINANETENFSNTLRSQIGVVYTGDFGAGLSLPASLNLNGSLIHTGKISTENFTFSRFVQGSLSDNYNLALIDTLNLSPSLTQQFDLSYSKYNSKIASSDTFHINALTHYFTRLADLNLKYDKTDFSADPFGYDSVPELEILPHIPFGNFRFPFTTQLTVGQYTEPQNHFSTQRVQGVINYPVALQLGVSNFNADVNVTQDYYGTGDEKGFITQNASLSTPLGQHVVNSVTYNEQNPLGPADVPFQLLDRLSSGAHSAQDVLRIFNGNVYSIQLSTGTGFDRRAQAIDYQISVRPSPRSLLLLGGYYQPGPGAGFYTTNVQGVAPLGPYTDIEYTTNVDYKNRFRLEDKNVYITKIIDCCYRIQASYNQDLKQFNLAANLLAFPSQGIGIGTGQGQSQILPSSFAF